MKQIDLISDTYGIFTKKLRVTPSIWSEKNCLVDGHPIRWSDFPHVPFILDLAADNTVEDITWVTSIGTGKTSMLFCYLAYNIVYGIVPIQWIMPTQESFLDNVIKPRWIPFMNACTELKNKLPDAKSGRTNFLFNFPGTPLKCSWAGAKQGKRGFHCGRVITDESADISDLEHYRGRTITFAGNKQCLHLGNHRKESNYLNKMYQQGSRHVYMVPNPNAEGEWMEMQFFGNTNSDDVNDWELLIDCDPEAKKNMNKDGVMATTYLKDPLTKQRWDPGLRSKLLRSMKWVPTNPYSTKSLSFTQNSLTTITKNPGELLWQWLCDKDDVIARNYFLQTYLAIPEREQSVIVLEKPSLAGCEIVETDVLKPYKRGELPYVISPYAIVGSGDIQSGDKRNWALKLLHTIDGNKFILDWYDPVTIEDMIVWFNTGIKTDFNTLDGRYRAKDVYTAVFDAGVGNNFVHRSVDRMMTSHQMETFSPNDDTRLLNMFKYHKESWQNEMFRLRNGGHHLYVHVYS